MCFFKIFKIFLIEYKTGNAEIDAFTQKLGLQGSVNTFAEIRSGVSSIKKEIEKAVGLNVQFKF